MKAKAVINSGIAYGKLIIQKTIHNVVKREAVFKEEIKRVNSAIDDCVLELNQISKNLKGEYFTNGSFVDAHLLLLKDPMLIDEIKDFLLLEKCNAEYAISEVISKYVKMIERSEDQYLKERKLDLLDVKNSLITRVLEDEFNQEAREDSILFVDELYPSRVVNLPNKIKGIIALKGSDTSHSSILCKVFDIPYVVIDDVELNGYVLIKDSEIILNPTKDLVANVMKKRERLPNARKLPFDLYANVSLEKEIRIAKKVGFSGIGLFRTEMLFIYYGRFLSFDEQIKVYLEASKANFPNTVTIRTFDLGDDKQIPYMPIKEKGIGIYNQFRSFLIDQIRAIVKANSLGNLRIMFPMIESNEDFQKLRGDVLTFAKDIKVGMMLETKRALEAIDTFTDVDFFSIGTNDLCHELYGMDRTDGVFDYRKNQDDLLERLSVVAKIASERGIELCVCGELASDYRFMSVLRTIGINKFSVNINTLKKFLNSDIV